MNPPLLSVTSLSKSFDGTTAVDSVTFETQRGELRGLIGPNGAGKTTLIKTITGALQPDSGKVSLGGRDVSNLPPHRRAQLGISSTSQAIGTFDELTVYENVAVAVQRPMIKGYLAALALDEEAIEERVGELLSQVGLRGLEEKQARELSYGKKRLLDLATALGTEPNLLLLDEPTQGLSSDEIDDFAEILLETKEEVAVLLAEHNIDVVMELCETIMVMHEAQLLAVGRPEEIEGDPEVRRVYLTS